MAEDHAKEGLFVPYETLFRQLNEKLDKILEKLDGKLDKPVFDAFQKSYEARHEALSKRVSTLEVDKTKRDAVTNYRAYILSGAALGGMAILFDTAAIFLRLTGHL